MKLTKLALFAAGYVLSAKAGRERYAQIVHGAAQASEKLEAFSSRHPRAARPAAPLVLTAVPDRNRRASDGVLIEASVLARLLGLRLLTLDATVVLMPADVTAPQSAAHRPAGRASARPPGRLPAGPGAASRGLAGAVRNINDGRAILAATRHNCP